MNRDTLRGRVAIVTGGSKGIGFGCAEALAEKGVNIVLCARNQQQLNESARKLEIKGIEILPVVADMGIADHNYMIIEQTLKKFNKIDILVNNSGGPATGTFTTFSDEDWIIYFKQVLLYNIRMTREVSAIMQNNNWGRIINITSLSVKEPAPGLVISNVFRAGVIAFAKSISKELIKNGVTINNLCPGAFKTERARELIHKRAVELGKTDVEIEQENVKRFPQGRYQECDEIGALAAFLCSDHAASITGTTIQIDGGISNCLL